ncbi:glycoside hydrolase family 16 protein [Piedraia hortae CBS 480.64]|uniref:Crh-like protein n=1 Tax=Piedraia hortae CBS 480.64 TaxID=1314780 RepID=A0A6A7C964_9PEZI|nr:glycoside hydrolase family 16 protein [Piedraia hortae CBS 480.64]
MRFISTVLAAALPLALAQTSSGCNPLKATCPEDVGLDASSFTSDFKKPNANASWSAAAYTDMTYGQNGAEFSIQKATQAPTVSTDFYFLFGRVDVRMKAAPGQGIISSIVLMSDTKDELDWEFTGGNNKQVQTNFFGKGNTTDYNRATYESVSNPQDEWHTYSFDWNSERINWLIDGQVVRTLKNDDPLTNGGSNYPQTPMQLKLGNWCGGCDGQSPGTVQWAGGRTTFGDKPYVMYVDSASITNDNPAKSYRYGDKSGSWQSIEITQGNNSTSDSSTSSSAPSSKPQGSATRSSGTSVASTATVAPSSSVSVADMRHETQVAVSITESAGTTKAIGPVATGGAATGTAGTVGSGMGAAPYGMNGTTAAGGASGGVAGTAGGAAGTGAAGPTGAGVSSSSSQPSAQPNINGAAGKQVAAGAVAFAAFAMLL